MLTGFEALGAASAVLQVISFATDVVVACKSAYDGATTSQDDLQRYAGQMSEAVDRVHTRCEQMRNANTKFESPKLQNIAKECKGATDKLEDEVKCATSLQAKGNLAKAIRKATITAWRRKKLQALEESLSMHQQVMKIELMSHLCSQSDAIYLQQDASFGKLDTDVQFLIGQIAQGITEVKDLVRREHVATRNAITQEGARAEAAINSHTDSRVLELRTTAETKRKCETFLQSLKAPRMNQRYNDVMDSRDASFNQVFATYEDMKVIYYADSDESGHSADDYESEHDDNSEDEDAAGDNDDPQDDNDPEDDADTGDDTEEIDSKSYESSAGSSNPGYMGATDSIYDSWFSFNSWLKSDDKLFYIQGKPGSGKSTLVKFVLNQDQTRNLVQEWSRDAIIISYFFWKIGSEEQNSIKGLWCSLLYQRLQDQQHLILSTLQQFNHLSLHSEYHDWSIKDLQDVWDYIAKLDTRHICMFIDGLDEVRDQDGFSKLSQSIQLISRPPGTKLCVSARPEAQIVRWLRTINAEGILLEDLTRFDMLQFVSNRFRPLLPTSQVSWETSEHLRQELVTKAQGVFLWLHLATRSIIEGIENNDSEEMLFGRLNTLPGDLENLYIDLWHRMNAKSPVYVETARRYFRYVLQDPAYPTGIGFGQNSFGPYLLPWVMQIACAESLKIQKKLLRSKCMVELTEILRKCEETKVSIQSRCAGLLEVRPRKEYPRLFERLGDNNNAFGEVAFIHRTAHDFLTDTEAGQGILGYGPLPEFSTETQMLNGLICAEIVLVSEWPLSYTDVSIIRKIIKFAERWGSESLPLATEMLDSVRPLYDRKSIRVWTEAWIPPDPFLSQLTGHDLFDEFVISRLATETPPVSATSVLRRGWALMYGGMSRRLFYALINLGADPHEYGISYSSVVWPFANKETAFTNLLLSFIFSFNYRKDEGDELHQQKLLGSLEIAIHMATTCQNLDKAVLLFARIRDGSMQKLNFEQAAMELPTFRSAFSFAVFEVSIQFLLLYMISKIGGDLINYVLALPQAQDVLSRLDNPLVKVRYIELPKATDNDSKKEISSYRTFQRILPQVPMLRSDIELLFGVDFERPSQELCVPPMRIELSPDIDIITKYVNNNETEEVNVEAMMTSLAAENLGICSLEEAGIMPSYEYLRESREKNYLSWELFSLTMGRLEAAAATREGIEGYE
ncbi:hypothetical protein FVEG_13724 [Fusarium verticillioides 7600]|uniref:Uncharacterized protein n=1 Tax=Gibberella moniliformis (strain M3125 / FGSC 7600) TaxID=334819 RepID=W7MWU6_GIBM7|nr:hypothetical protein FVEG_13724 [Fusarium verticillioides 7600]EWG55773.1 hypothetical protein FVEG_13724 [Fusarium verticillioides 7600]